MAPRSNADYSSDDSIAKINVPQFPLPEPILHMHVLPDERKFAYYTFKCKGEEEEEGSPTPSTTVRQSSEKHPVLYFNGFPGSGIEGAICASEVAARGGELYAPDRPGFGYSDPLPPPDKSFKGNKADYRLDMFINDVWNFIEHCGWKKFSIIGVSGGGPFALAMVNSYLSLLNNASSPQACPPAKLEAVSFVAGVCCSAGTEDMMSMNQTVHKHARNVSTSFWDRTMLGIMLGIPRVLVKTLPASILLKTMMSNKELPQVDQELLANKDVAQTMIDVLKLALRQGACASVLESEICLGKELSYESSLKQRYASDQSSGLQNEMPQIAIFQGLLDKNVPPSHGRYVHKELLGELSTYVEYEDLGHLSLVVGKVKDYVPFVIPALVVDDSDENE